MDKLVEQFLRLYEKKDHLIKKLSNLTDEDKETLIKLFKEKPHLESKIDWNNKNLTIEDFDEVLNYVSKTEASNLKNKRIPSNFIEGRDYFDITEDSEFKAIVPLNHEFQKFIQNSSYDGLTCKWCIGSNDGQKYWDRYTKDSYFIIIVSDRAKIAVQVTLPFKLTFWNAEDFSTKSDKYWDRATQEEKELLSVFLKQKTRFKKRVLALPYKKEPLIFVPQEDDSVVATYKGDGLFSITNDTLQIPSISPDGKPVTRIAGFSQLFPTIKKIILPEGLKVIGEDAFLYSEHVEHINIPDSVEVLKSSSFRWCTNLKQAIIGKGVTNIGNFAFVFCNNLEKVVLPPNITEIKHSVFQSCFNLQSISIPKKVSSIGLTAFAYCYSLDNITIPDSVKIISEKAFFDCKELKTVYTNYTKDNYPKDWNTKANEYLFNAEWKPIPKTLVESFLTNYS